MANKAAVDASVALSGAHHDTIGLEGTGSTAASGLVGVAQAAAGQQVSAVNTAARDNHEGDSPVNNSSRVHHTNSPTQPSTAARLAEDGEPPQLVQQPAPKVAPNIVAMPTPGSSNSGPTNEFTPPPVLPPWPRWLRVVGMIIRWVCSIPYAVLGATGPVLSSWTFSWLLWLTPHSPYVQVRARVRAA